MKKLLLTTICIAFFGNLFASHLAGGRITYKYLSGNSYILKLELIRDCKLGNATLASSTSIKCQSATNAQNINISLPQTDFFKIKDYCDTINNSCASPLSIYQGYELYEYSDTFTFPMQASDWLLSYNNCCRNSAISNLTAPGGLSIYLYAKLDNLNTPLNSNVTFPQFSHFVLETNQNYTMGFGGTDVDGDSLDFQLDNALNGTLTTNCAYQTPYTFSSPFPSSIPINLNNQTGELNFNCTQIGNYVVAMKCNEYRNGIIVGITHYEIILTFVANSGNNLPTLTGTNPNNIYTIFTCPSSTLNFTLNSADVNVNDSTFISWDTSIANANFNIIAGQNENANFSWIVDTADVRPQPYLVIFTVKDNHCPLLGTQSYIYQIYVNQCNTDSVWAGDANADFTCNNYDVLAIGIANNATGPLRAGATTNWQAEYCPNWPNAFASNINQKHADCNGDGTVNNLDLNAVSLNYGQVHFKNKNLPGYKGAGLPDLYFDLSNISAFRGSTVNIPIMLGNSVSNINDLYGISASIQLTNAQTSAPIAFDDNISWLGNSSNRFKFNFNTSNDGLDFTLVKNNQTNENGYGQIGTLIFPIHINSVVGSEVILQFTDVKMISYNENEIINFNVLSDTLTILAANNIDNVVSNNSIFLSPNPAKDQININGKVVDGNQYEIYDISGGKIQEGLIRNAQVNIGQLAKGMYLIQVFGRDEKKILRFIKD